MKRVPREMNHTLARAQYFAITAHLRWQYDEGKISGRSYARMRRYVAAEFGL